MKHIASAIDRIDNVKLPVLLWINAALSAFVALAHGGALLMYHLGKAPELSDQAPTLYTSLPAAVFCLLLSFFGLALASVRLWVLKIQAGLLLVLAVGLIYFALDVVAFGIAPHTNFTWNPVLFAFVVAYPVYLARRVFVMPGAQSPVIPLFAPLWVAAGSMVISILVLWRVWGAAT